MDSPDHNTPGTLGGTFSTPRRKPRKKFGKYPDFRKEKMRKGLIFGSPFRVYRINLLMSLGQLKGRKQRKSNLQSFLNMIEKRQNQHGDFGLYALVDIPANTRLFSYNEWIEDEKFGWEVLTLDELDKLSYEDRDHFLKYGYDFDFGKIIGTFNHENARNHSNFMNHSCDPNMIYDTDDNIIAKRHIFTGEELTIDYGNFIVNVDQGFICRCGAHSCRGRITKDDWKNLVPVLGYNFPKFMHTEIEKLIHRSRIPA